MFRNQNYNTDPGIRLMPGLKKKRYFWPFGPQFGLKIRVGGWVGGGEPSPRSAKVLSPETPLLDEVLGKRLSWHPLAIYNPSLLLRETVSCRGFPGRGLFRLGSPPSPPKIANTWSSCSTLFTSELKTTATIRIAPKKCFHGNAECQSRLQLRSILYPGLCSIQVYLRKEHVSYIRCSTFTLISRFLLIWFTISL